MMQAELSVKGTSPFRKMVGFTLNKNKAIIILGCVLTFLVMPVFALSMSANYSDVYSSADFLHTYIKAGLFICWTISTAFTAFLTVINMGFMHSKNASDLFFALPITRSRLYVARLLASFIGGSVPMLIAGLSAIILSLFYNVPDVSNGALLVFLGATLVSNAVIAVVFGFFMLFTGRTFDSILAILVLNIGLPVIAVIVLWQITNNLYGIGESAFSAEFFMGFSPLTSMGYWMFSILDEIETLDCAVHADKTLAVIWFAISAVLMVLSIDFAKKRRCEAAGNAYAHPIVPVITISVVGIISAFAFGAIFTFDLAFTPAFAVFAIIGGLLCSAVMGAIFNRSFKNLVRSLTIGAGGVAVYLAFLIAVSTGGLGFENRIPSIDKIESATYIMDNYNGGVYADDIASTTYTDNQDIENLLRVHKNIVENKNINRDGWGEITIAYRLKNGTIMRRVFEVENSLDANGFKTLIENEKRMNNLSVRRAWMDSIAIESYFEGQYVTTSITKEQAERVLSAYVSDSHNLKYISTDKQICIYGLYIYDDGKKVLNKENTVKNTINLNYSDEFTETSAVIKEILLEAKK